MTRCLVCGDPGDRRAVVVFDEPLHVELCEECWEQYVTLPWVRRRDEPHGGA